MYYMIFYYNNPTLPPSIVKQLDDFKKTADEYLKNKQ